MQYIILFSFSIIMLGKTGLAALIVLFLSCCCYCSEHLHRGAMCLSVVYDCGISWSYLFLDLDKLFNKACVNPLKVYQKVSENIFKSIICFQKSK